MARLPTWARAEIDSITVDDRIEQTFGPNECVRLRFLNTQTQEEHLAQCDLRRCVECGPRKQLRLWLQLTNLLGVAAWIGRTDEHLDRDLAREKKAAQRSGSSILYCVVGDIIISDVQIQDSQRFMELAPWRQRITETYMFALNRMRRSRVFGRMSRVTLKRGGQVGTPWIVRFLNRAQIVAEGRDYRADDHGWHVWTDERGNLRSTLSL